MKKIFTMLSGLLVASALTAQAEVITVYVDDYDYNQLADPFETSITKDAEGNYILTEFFNSGAPLSFTFEQPAVDASSNMEFTGYLDTSANYPYLMDAEGNYPTCWAWGYNGLEDWTGIQYPYMANQGYSWVYRYDKSNPDNYYEYFGRICMCGSDAEGNFFPWMYLDFYFNEPETSGVAAVEAAENAPVEFYNLNGQRVENPANGIYVRKQGSKTSKVVIR